MIEVRPYRRDLAQQVWDGMRESDRFELEQVGAIRLDQFEDATELYVGLIDGVPLGVWGCHCVRDYVCHPFYWARPEVREHRGIIARFARRYLFEIAHKYWPRELLVPADDRGREWLQWLGFQPTRHKFKGLRLYRWSPKRKRSCAALSQQD